MIFLFCFTCADFILTVKWWVIASYQPAPAFLLQPCGCRIGVGKMDFTATGISVQRPCTYRQDDDENDDKECSGSEKKVLEWSLSRWKPVVLRPCFLWLIMGLCESWYVPSQFPFSFLYETHYRWEISSTVVSPGLVINFFFQKTLH